MMRLYGSLFETATPRISPHVTKLVSNKCIKEESKMYLYLLKIHIF